MNGRPRTRLKLAALATAALTAAGLAFAGRFLSVDRDLPDLARRAADIKWRDVLQPRFVPQ